MLREPHRPRSWPWVTVHLLLRLNLDLTFVEAEGTFALRQAETEFSESSLSASSSLTLLIIRAVEMQLAALVYFCLPLKARLLRVLRRYPADERSLQVPLNSCLVVLIFI